MRMMGVPAFPRAIAIPVTFASDATVFVGTDNRGTDNPPTVGYRGLEVPTQGFFTSLDRGNTWTPSGLPEATVDVIEVSPGFASDGTLFAGGVRQGLYRSETRGRRWTSIPDIAHPVLAVALSPQFPSDGTVFAGTTMGLFESTDGGRRWARLPEIGNDGAVSIALSTSFPTDQTMFVATPSRGLTRSTDGGRTFTELALPESYVSAVAVSSAFARDRTVFAAGYQGIYRSVDGGSTWRYSPVPARIEESRTGNVFFQGAWKTLTDATPSTSGYALTTEPGATVVVEFTGTGVTWIGPEGPKMSAADVVLDGLPPQRVSLTTDRQRAQVPLWEREGLACERHALRITAVGAAGRTGVALDAFDVSRGPSCVSAPDDDISWFDPQRRKR
jgi:photosystem II stability/assembly factor-like uncharacterized protein